MSLARLFFRALIAPLALLATMLLATVLPASARQLPLDEISRYLNGLSTVEAQFTQINADQTISTGTILIKRPGRARFDYNPPDKTLVIAGGQQLAVFDAKSNTGPEQYPLDRTPLNLILARDIDLSTAGMVVGTGYDGTATTVTAQDPEHPEYGNIKLMFTADPVQLRQWVVTDDVGNETTVILGETTTGGELSASLFSITQEIARRNR